MFYKPEIRKKLRAQRRYLDKHFMISAATSVAAQIIHLSCFLESKTIAFYLPQENELDTQPSIQCAVDLNKQLFLPVISKQNDKVLTFYSYHLGDELIPNRYDIVEPNTEKQTPIPCEALDIIIVPLVGFDKDGNRLGRGAGYYDRTLSFIHEMPKPSKPPSRRPMLIGLGYEFQKITSIERSKWDVPLDCVITEAQVYQ